MKTLLAKNADILVTMDKDRREIKNASLYAEDGVIKKVGPASGLPQTADTVIDMSGQVVLPGFVNCHHHLNQTLTRNLPSSQNNNLFPWLRGQYRIWAGITPEASRTSVIVGLGVDGSASNDSSNMMLEVRTAFLLARVKMALLPPEGPEKYMNLSQSHAKRAAEWMTAREALELGTLGGAKVLGRDDIGSLETGKCADFFSINLNTVDFAGALHDPVAATVFCAPQKAQHTIINGRVIVQDGKCITVDLDRIVEDHNKFSISLANAAI